MNSDDIRRTVVTALCDVAPEIEADKLDPKAELRSTLDLDSMDFLNFMVGMAERSGMKIPAQDAPKLRTLAGLEAYFAPARSA